MTRRGARPEAVPLVGLLVGLGYTIGALGYRVGTLEEPGPGLFPRLVGAALIATSVWGLWPKSAGLRTDVKNEHKTPSIRFAIVVVGLLCYAILLVPLGSVVANFLLSLALLLVVGWRGWIRAAAAAACITLIVQTLFVNVLAVPLPRGIWPW